MNDFEVHPIGTKTLLESYLTEIRLSRALAREIEQVYEQYNTIPTSVLRAYRELKAHYSNQIDEDIQ